jgi:hypothetical protein
LASFLDSDLLHKIKEINDVPVDYIRKAEAWRFKWYIKEEGGGGDELGDEVPSDEIYPIPGAILIENADDTHEFTAARGISWELLANMGEDEELDDEFKWIAFIPVETTMPYAELRARILLAVLKGCDAYIVYDRYEGHEHTRFMFPPRKEHGVDTGYKIPGLSINYSVVQRIMKDMESNPVRFYFYLKQTDKGVKNSHNVIGIRNLSKSDDFILISGHYDGWWGQSSCDNAVGTATMLGIAKYLPKGGVHSQKY